MVGNLGCKFRLRFRSLMGRDSVGTQNEAQMFGGAVLVSVVFFFNLKATQLKLPRYPLLFEVRRLKNDR